MNSTKLLLGVFAALLSLLVTFHAETQSFPVLSKITDSNGHPPAGLSGGIMWEDLHKAGVLYDRVVYLNQMASPLQGFWPVADNPANGGGQDGKGKGQMQKHNTFRPWPNAYLVQLTDENGKPLDAAARAAYQNPGY